MKLPIALIAFCVPLCGQFSNLASTGDGVQLYFSSPMTLFAAPYAPGEYAIYRFTENGLEPFQQDARLPQVSEDGRTVGFTSNGFGVLRGLRTGTVGAGSFVMSRNGRWAVLTGTPAPPPVNGPAPSVLVNLETGERTPLPGTAAGTFPVASDGTVFIQGMGLWRGGKLEPLVLNGPFSAFGLSDDARLLVYTQLADYPAAPRQSILARDLASGNDTVVFSRLLTEGPVMAMGMSNDGRKILYRLPRPGTITGPAFVFDSRSGSTDALPLGEKEYASAGALSGYGNRAFLVTTTGRLLAFETASPAVPRELIPTTAYVAPEELGRPLVPGSLVRLAGTLFRPDGTLGGRIWLDDIPAPIRFANETEAGVQIPWELAGRTQARFRLESVTPSPFLEAQQVTMAAMFPRFEPLGTGETSVLGFKAIKGDFSGLLTGNPHPGDVIVVYATGLGPVRGPVATGMPAPTDRPIEIEGRIRCRFFPYETEAETLFAGLAPGLTGIYQINFRLPEGPDPGRINGGMCTFSGAGVEGGFSWMVAKPVGN
jgi:uncharacterized protein (TIGR03437 family)